jgi:tetratricopeptide (TPR) repeat protein
MNNVCIPFAKGSGETLARARMRSRTMTGRMIVAFASLYLLGGVGTAAAATAVGDLGRVGGVEFPISCRPAVKKDFERGLALLHSFFYEEAQKHFSTVVARDPGCAIGYWGIAMSQYHPIWAPPDAAALTAGQAAVAKAQSVGKPSERERDYIDAIATFYAASTAPPPKTAAAAAGPPLGVRACHGDANANGVLDHSARALAYAAKMERLHAKYPDDVETSAFYALALLGSATPSDKTLANQRKAGELLEKLFATHRDHPGVVHYLIHAYDYPSLAERALPAAQHYAQIAPWVPHVLHMPSHTFSRLGMWSDVIASNLASAEAARQYAAEHHPGAASFEELHALDYLEFGYLQMGDDANAKETLARLQAIHKTFPEQDLAVAYAEGAGPARYALERHRFDEAAQLTISPSPLWSKFPFGEAHLQFARALGAAHTGKLADAHAAVERLGALRETIKEPKFKYWVNQIEVQRLGAAGWVAHVEGRQDEAQKLLRQAAEAEEAAGPHPVSPGAILPARELLGDLLLELKQPAAAATEYELELRSFPRRFNALYGAGRAQELAGHKDAAKRYYTELLSIAPHSTRHEIVEARAALARR